MMIRLEARRAAAAFTAFSLSSQSGRIWSARFKTIDHQKTDTTRNNACSPIVTTSFAFELTLFLRIVSPFGLGSTTSPESVDVSVGSSGRTICGKSDSRFSFILHPQEIRTYLLDLVDYAEIRLHTIRTCCRLRLKVSHRGFSSFDLHKAFCADWLFATPRCVDIWGIILRTWNLDIGPLPLPWEDQTDIPGNKSDIPRHLCTPGLRVSPCPPLSSKVEFLRAEAALVPP